MRARWGILIGLLLVLAVSWQKAGERRTAPGDTSDNGAFLPSGGYATGTPRQQAEQIAGEVEASLRGGGTESAYAFHMAEFYLDNAVHIDRSCSVAHRLLGRVLTEQVRYGEAEDQFLRAMGPGSDRGVWDDLEETRRVHDVLASLPLALKGHQRVFRLAEVAGRDPPSVFVLVGDDHYDWYEAIEARYFVWREGGYEETFSTTQLGQPDANGAASCDFARIFVHDYQRTGRPQILVFHGYHGNYLGGNVDAFETEGDRLRRVLSASSDDGVEPEDMDGDRRPELKATTFVIGPQVPGAGKGRWHEIYRYNGRCYVRDNPRFPALARQQLKEMLHMEEQYPSDWVVLEHVARACRDAGQPDKAGQYEKRARPLKARDGQ